jgi:hypothetical protein
LWAIIHNSTRLFITNDPLTHWLGNARIPLLQEVSNSRANTVSTRKRGTPHMELLYTVRVVYVVPKDAQPWQEAATRATYLLEDLQWFFVDEMHRLGYGPKTFQIERAKSGRLVFQQIPSDRRRQDFQKRKENGDQLFVDHCKRGLRRFRTAIV